MIRTFAIILALSTSFVALSAVEAAAQVTDQTDKSEEDWRKSKKKRDTSDIFEDILNRRSTGQGNGTYPQNPIDSLPEESRRHLMKERAKVIAESDPGTTPDAPYEPSEAAKTDPELAEQEKEAWTVIMTDMKGGNSSGQGQAGTGPNKIAVAGQGGGQGDNQNRNSSVMRGGSSQSVADIMAQIKGIKSARGGTSSSPSQGPLGTGSRSKGPLGTGGGRTGTDSGEQKGSQNSGAQGQGSQGQSQGQSQSDAQAQAMARAQAQAQVEAKADAAGEAAAQAQAQADAAAQAARQANAEAQAKADATSKMKAEIANDIAEMAQAKADSAAQEAAQAKAEAEATSAAQAGQDAQAEAQAEAIEKAKQAPESIGPLDRIKREREERPAGTQTSASDYLKTSK